MANEFKTPYTSITGTFLETNPDTGVSTYMFTNTDTGAEQKVGLGYTPEQIAPLLRAEQLSTEAGVGLSNTLRSTFDKLRSKDDRGVLDRIVKPVGRSIPAYFAGGFPDIMGLLSYVPGPVELTAMGYEALTGVDPFGASERGEQRRLSSRKVAEEYGSKAQQKRFSQYLRQADRWAQDNWGFKPFEDSVGTDMTPEARGFWERTLATGLELGTSGPLMVKGAVVPAKLLQDGAQFLFSRFAKKSAAELGEAASDPKNVQSLIDKANEAYSLLNEGGRRNIRQEVGFGFAGGVATEAALDQLQKVDPDAAEWVKASVAIGSGLLAPVAVRGGVTALLEGPVIRLATTVVIDPILRPARAATSFAQRQLGGSSQDRAAVASTSRLLEEAVADGRHVNAASGLAFTTPELARTEANILRAEIRIKQDRLSQETDPKVQQRLRQEIGSDEASVGNLNRTANFYENVLESAAQDRTPGVASRFFQDESRRLVERRDQFFNYIEGEFKRSVDELDFNGKPGGTPDELRVDLEKARDGRVPEFEANRRKLVMEGDPRGVESSELLWLDPQTKTRVDGIQENLSAKMDEALAKAQDAANDRVKFWDRSVQLALQSRGLKSVADLPGAERALVGDITRVIYDDAAREFRAFERAAYRRVEGLDSKVTENIVFPEGSKDPSNGADISGMTVEEWATSRFDNLSATEAFNLKDLPPQLAHLAGSRSIVAQITRRRRDEVAAGRASNAEEKIPVLEQRRDDAILQRDNAEVRLNEQRDADNALSESSRLTLKTYYTNAVENLPRGSRQAVEDFMDKPLDWAEMSPAAARTLGEPLGLGKIFAEIAKQKKRIASLGEGTAFSKASQAIDKKMEGFAARAQKAQADIDGITNKFLGVGDEVQVPETGRLTARDGNGDLVRDGTSADDVKEFVSELAEAARIEKAANGTSAKYRKIQQIRDTVEQLLDTRTFPDLDAGQLNFARQASRVKRNVDDAQGPVLKKTRGSEVKVEVESVPETVLPGTTSPTTSAANLRLLRESTAEVPDFVTITKGPDGTVLAAIDEKALDGSASLFDRPDSPFEMVSVGETGTPFEIRLKPDAPVTPRSLKVAESILLERLALSFPDGVDSKGLEAFRNNNKAALKFLEDNGRADVPDLLANADNLAVQLDALGTLRRDKTRRQLTELVDNGSLDLNGLEIDDYLEYIGQRRRRISEASAFSEVLNADPGRAVDTLFDRILSGGNNRPKQDMQEFLSLVRGNKQAEKGLQASILGQLFKRSITRSDPLSKETQDLAFQAFDPVKFRELMGDARVRTILQEAFPDNPSLLDGLGDMAKVAFETSNFTQGGKTMGKINPAEALNLSGWAFLGRISGLGAADATKLVNQLWAGAAGSKVGQSVGRKITGVRIKDILLDAALNPEKGAALGLQAGNQKSGFRAALGQAAIDVINVPGTVASRPGASGAIIKRGLEELDEDPGPQSAVQPAGPPPRRMAASVPQREVTPASMMSRVNPVGPAPAAPAQAGQTSQQTLAGLRELGMPLFVNQGGYIGGGDQQEQPGGIMSVRRKPRQMVG